MSRGRRWILAAAVLLGTAVGLGAFTFGYAKGSSYLTNDPAACANCHVMREHFAAWTKASHRSVATCNDCHTPHDVLGKYATKARNGFWHSFYFTTGRFPEPIRITPASHRIVERACRDCHREITSAIDPGETGAAARVPAHDSAGSASPSTCVRCHPHVGHWVR